MLMLTIQGQELYNEVEEKFITVNGVDLTIEHSLLSLSKWESKFEKPFLDTNTKTAEEVYAYLECMIISPEGLFELPPHIGQEDLVKINDYINSNQTATTFGAMPQRGGHGETITSELIYYWMVAFNIPFGCESWHLNRLFALIRICNLKQNPGKKMSRHEIVQRNRELNEQRKREFNTNG